MMMMPGGYYLPSSTAGDCSTAARATLRCLIPSNNDCFLFQYSPQLNPDDTPLDLYSTDWFRMYVFKVRQCPRGRPAHDWTECPYAHPGEKARRRDPAQFRYSSAACPGYRKGPGGGGGCKRGDACELSHGVFECWLHPERYRTQSCKDGTACRRRVCFFAHTAEQLRLIGTPTSILQAWPPVSPELERMEEVVALMEKMRIGTAAVGVEMSGGGSPEEEEEVVPDVGWVTELVSEVVGGDGIRDVIV